MTLLGRFGRYSAYLVDAEELRGSSLSNEEFGDWAIHGSGPSQLSVVPVDEVWISGALDAVERQVALSTALRYLELHDRGEKPEEAYHQAVAFGAGERECLMGYSRQPTTGPYPDGLFLAGPRELPTGQRAWLVDGDVVRVTRWFHKPDFVLGGNGLVYAFIRPMSIWIEKDVSKDERIYVLLHEVVESYQMRTADTPYHEAHKKAEQVEYRWRHTEQVPDVAWFSDEWVKKQLGD